MKRRILIAIVLSMASLTLCCGRGACRELLEVRPVSPALFDVEPGAIVTLSFRVANRSEEKVELAEDLRLPDGWRPVMPTTEFTLGPGLESTRLAVVQADRALPAGEYVLTYALSGRRDGVPLATTTVTAHVRPVYDLSLTLEGTPPEQTVAGEPFAFDARLNNRGNADLSVRMLASITRGGRVSVEPESFLLKSGESRPLRVSAVADPAVHRLSRHHIELRAQTEVTVEDRPVEARLGVHFDVVPLVAGQDMYHRYPVEYTARFGAEDEETGLQFALQGSGSLDEKGEKRLDFMIQAPDRTEGASFGLRDEYWLKYADKGYTARAGDMVYGLSPLTSLHRYGRGVEMDYKPAGSIYDIGIYHTQDRWSLQKRQDTGAYVAVSPAPGTQYRMNFLILDYEAWLGQPSTREILAGLQGRFSLGGKSALEMEVAAGSKDAAWSLDWNGEMGADADYSLSARRSGPDFPGRYADTALYNGALSFPLLPALRGNLSYGRYERNLCLISANGNAPRENLYRGGLSARLPDRWMIGLDYDYYDRRDVRPSPAFDLRENGLRLSLGRSSDPFSYRAEVRRSWTENRLNDEDRGGWNYTLSTTYRPSRTFYMTLFGGLGDDEEPGESRLLRRGSYLGGILNWRPSSAITLNLNYSLHDLDYPDLPLWERAERDYYGAGISWRLPNQHRLDLNIRRSESTVEGVRTSYYATYVAPFTVPLGRKKSVGALSGRVYRQGEPGEPGLAGAIVYVDGTAVRTDGGGRFIFRTLSPGQYAVRLDERSIGLDRIPASSEALKVTIIGGKTVEADIPIIRTGRISGKIILVADGNGNGMSNGSGAANGHITDPTGNRNGNGHGKAGLADILVEISREGETRRTVSDGAGAFLFERLHPGEWKLRVYTEKIPHLHYVESESRTIEVASGEDAQALVRVLPRQREIQFVDEGRISAVPTGQEGSSASQL